MQFNFEENIVLENKVVRLEPLQLSHAATLKPVVMNNKGVFRYLPSRFDTEELLTEYIRNNIALREMHLKYPFAIFSKSDGEYAGSTSFLNISSDNQRLEIGSTWIGKKFQRTGLNRNCKYLLMHFAFEKLNAERVEFKTDSRNKKSQKAIEGVGGKYEGVLRSHTLMPDGFRRDTVYYSVLKSEWPEVRDTVFRNIANSV